MGQTQIAPTESDLTASYLSERGLPSPSLKWLLVATILVTACLGPTFISYQPIILRWDDADYLMRAVAASRAFWSGDVHRLGAAMVSVHTPIMTFLGLPWGSLASWDSAGKCFLSLAAVIALLAALCVYMLLRIGVKPIFLVAAAICVGVSLGPYPAGEHAATIDVHALATGFYTDNLLAWLVLAAVLLIPFEARTSCLSVSSAVVRGVLCASIFSLGATKVSFFYFIVIIAPLLLYAISLWWNSERPCLADRTCRLFRANSDFLSSIRTNRLGQRQGCVFRRSRGLLPYSSVTVSR